MNRNRKKTVLPLEYQIESFFKKVLYLNYELVTKKIEKNSKPPDIENLDLETLIYEGMKRYEELIKIFKINSEKGKDTKRKSNSKKKHKYTFTKNRTDIFNFGNRRNKIEKENEYRYKNYDNKYGDYNYDNDLNNSKASKKNVKLFGSSYDSRNLQYKKNKDDKKIQRSIKLYKDDKHDSHSKNKKNSKNKNNSKNKYKSFNHYDYNYGKNNNNNIDEDKYEKNKLNDNELYEKESKYNIKERIYYYDNDRYDKLDKSPDYDNDYKEKYNDNEGDNHLYNGINKENYNYNKFNVYDNNKEKEDKINKYSLNKETKYETFKRNITDDRTYKNSIYTKRANNSLQSRYKYKYKYIGNKDKTVSEVSDSKQNRWMKKKTNINNSIISRSKNGDYDESQDVSRSRNTWLKKRMPFPTLQNHEFSNVNKNQTFEKEITKKYIKNLKMNEYNLGKKYEKHNFNDLGKSQEKKNYHENIKDILVKSQRIGNDIYNINYGKIVNKNMYINIYKAEPKKRNIFFHKQTYEEKDKKDENNVYNYTHNYYNIYKEEEDDANDNICREYGKKLIGKEMLKKCIRDKEERERLDKKDINIYANI